MKRATIQSVRLTRAILVAIVTAGTLLFGSCWLATYLLRAQIEGAARSFVRSEVERKVRTELVNYAGGDDKEAAGLLRGVVHRRVKKLEALIDSQLPELIAEVWASMCNIECEERKAQVVRAKADVIRKSLRGLVHNLGKKDQGLVAYIKGLYLDRLQALISDLRLFTGINALLFGLCGALLWLRRNDMQQALLPIGILSLTTLISAAAYVFGQDWFWTILTGDFMGLAYLVLVSVVLAFVCDVVFLRGKVTRAILEALPSALVPSC